METPSLIAVSDAIKAEFEQITEWSERTKHLMTLADSLPAADPCLLVEENRIVGCQSRVWIFESPASSANALDFVAYSDSSLMRGIIALVLRIYNGASCVEALKHDVSVLTRIGLDSYLAPGRSNGLHLLVKRIHRIAAAHMESIDAHEATGA